VLNVTGQSRSAVVDARTGDTHPPLRDRTLKVVITWSDSPYVHVTLASGSTGAPNLEPSDVFLETFRDVLGGLISSPWLVGLFALLTVRAVVGVVRVVLHGGRPRDPQRRFSRSERAEILARAGNRCEQHSWLFGRCRETEGLQADHIHPHSRGGATAVKNGQALCGRHNKQKSARVPWNWELTRLARRRESYFLPGTPTAVVRHRARAGQTVEV